MSGYFMYIAILLTTLTLLAAALWILENRISWIGKVINFIDGLTVEQVAKKVIMGGYGKPDERKERIETETRFSYEEVKEEVNKQFGYKQKE